MERALATAVIVLGCGVSGLSTAIRLAEDPRRRFDVRVVADRAPGATMSRLAGAVWYPYAVRHPHVRAWMIESLRTFVDLARAGTPGVRLRPGRELFREYHPESEFRDVLLGYRHEAPGPDAGCAADFVDSYVFETPCIEMPSYLEYLARRFEACGRAIESRHVERLEELCDRDAVVVNCSGVFARALVPDPDLRPTLGQLVRVDGPRIGAFRLDEMEEGKPAYIVPRGTDCVLGSIDEPYDVDRHGYEPPPPDPERTRDIVERCSRLDSEIRGARVLEAYCGLRPARREVRLERDAAAQARGRRLVHNYGHGGAGVTLSWGCAAEAVELVARSMDAVGLRES